jgi:3-oxoacyl-[acyl-carrier-protein] synthase-3
MMFWSDGAGAVSLLKEKQSTSGLKGRAHLSSTQSNMAVRLVWRSTHGADGSLLGRQTEPVEMGGLATWREATSGVPEVVRGALVNAGAKLDDIDYFIFHQANLRMIEYLTKKLRLNEDRVLTNVAEVGNLGAASIPVMLAQANQNGVLCRGDKILMVAVGAGFTFVALVWEW